MTFPTDRRRPCLKRRHDDAVRTISRYKRDPLHAWRSRSRRSRVACKSRRSDLLWSAGQFITPSWNHWGPPEEKKKTTSSPIYILFYIMYTLLRLQIKTLLVLRIDQLINVVILALFFISRFFDINWTPRGQKKKKKKRFLGPWVRSPWRKWRKRECEKNYKQIHVIYFRPEVL